MSDHSHANTAHNSPGGVSESAEAQKGKKGQKGASRAVRSPKSQRREPRAGEVAKMSDGRLLSLYRAACERLSVGGWRGEPLASRWARALCDELCERGRLDDCLAIEAECRECVE